MIQVEWSFANSAYVILWGDSLIDIDGQRFFQNRRELRNSISSKGLKLIGNKLVAK